MASFLVMKRRMKDFLPWEDIRFRKGLAHLILGFHLLEFVLMGSHLPNELTLGNIHETQFFEAMEMQEHKKMLRQSKKRTVSVEIRSQDQ